MGFFIFCHEKPKICETKTIKYPQIVVSTREESSSISHRAALNKSANEHVENNLHNYNPPMSIPIFMVILALLRFITANCPAEFLISKRLTLTLNNQHWHHTISMHIASAWSIVVSPFSIPMSHVYFIERLFFLIHGTCGDW